MAAQSPLRSFSSSQDPPMADRPFTSEEHAMGGGRDPLDRRRRWAAGGSLWPSDDVERTTANWRRPLAGSSQSRLPPPSHGLRYGSTFPHGAVSGTNVEPFRDKAEPGPWQGDASGDDHRRRPDETQHTLRRIIDRPLDDDPLRRGMSAIQYLLSEQWRGGQRGGVTRELWRNPNPRHELAGPQTADRHRSGPMPSLGAVLQQRGSPGSHGDDNGTRWRDCQPRDGPEGFDRPAYAPVLARDGRFGASGRSVRRDVPVPLTDYRGPLPSLLRLSSLAERRSISSSSTLSESPVRNSPQVAARSTFRDAPSRESPATEARLHLESHSSPSAAVADLGDPPAPGAHGGSNDEASAGDGADGADGTAANASAAPQRKKKKRKVRICTTPGCDRLVVDHGVCIRHGGGKRCNVEGCNCRAQNKGLCWKHGGYTICQVDGCDKRAKSRGMCWSHGGGTQCKTDSCEKIAVSRGRCWAHGGGKRCKLSGCQKPAALRMDDYCAEHFAAHRAAVGSRGPAEAREQLPRSPCDAWQ